MGSAVEAVKLASGLFVIPLMMAFSPLLLSAEYGWTGVLVSAAVTGLLLLMLMMVMQRYLFASVSAAAQLAALLAAALLVYPSGLTRMLGALLAALLMAINYRQGQADISV